MADFTPQQKQAITAIDCNVEVSAGAGSGKTRVLVERFLHILKQGISSGANITASEILAITFTRKAAAEMKERVRKTMEALLAADVDNAGFWRKQLTELERAQITTIHSFCNKILKENPVESELDPTFQVAEEFEGQEFLDESLKEFLRKTLQEQNEAVTMLTDTYGVGGFIRQLQSLLPYIEDIKGVDLLQPYNESIKQDCADKARLCSLLEELAARRDEATKSQVDDLANLAENITAVIGGIKQAEPDFAAYDLYVGKIKNTNKKLKDLINEIREIHIDMLLRVADGAALPLVTAWKQVLLSFADYLQARKSEADFLTFDDLETLALDLLLKNEQVRKKYQQKYAYIMVDEFQDTNERQKQLIYLLCGDSTDKLCGDKLFVVGDPKQSIYRFRGADVSVFAKVRQDIKAKNGVEILLADNFRTVDTILEACNEAFAKLLGTDKSSDVYFEPLRANRSSDIKPRFLQIACDEELSEQKRYLEAAAIADEIVALKNDGVNYNDTAILLRAMTNCNIITGALQSRGIPFQVIDGKGFYERQEVIDVLNLLAALQNRHRSLELAGILRSPYFGLDDETLTALFLQCREQNLILWDMLRQIDITIFKEKQQKLVRRAAELLQELRNAASLLALPDLMQEIFCKLNVVAVLSLQNDGEAKLANVKKLTRLADEYSSLKHGTLADWLGYIDKLRAAKARETAANLNDDDAVTIMTIHKSKGLEFSTVFLPMLDARSQSDTAEIKFHACIGLGVKVTLADGKQAETSVLAAVKEADKELQKAERQRQLYVAMTRAKDRLIMSGAFKNGAKSSADNWFNALKEIYADSVIVENRIIDAGEIDLQAVCLQTPQQFTVTDAVQKAIAVLPQYETSGKKNFTATALQTYLHCPRQYFYQQLAKLPVLDSDNNEESGELPAFVVGLIVHRALENYADDLDAAFKAAVDEFADKRYAAAAKAKALLQKYLASDLFTAQSGEKLREVKFNMRLEDGFSIDGVIDCVTQNADGSLKIIDYKTGKPPIYDKVYEGYLYQTALYKAAAEKLFEKRVADVQLHFLQNLSVWNLPDDDGIFEQAIALCKKISAKKYEHDFECNTASCVNCQYLYLCPQK